MSAVAALFWRDGRPANLADIAPLVDAAPHRGRDGSFSKASGPAALAWQRFDPWGRALGREPEEDPLGDEKILLVADLRLDNRSELCRRLDLPETTGDNGILRAAYRRWGEECCRYLLGDFAFAIWDAGRQHLFFARDPLGVRDLAYFLGPNLCIVASEVAQVASLPCVSRDPDEAKVALYLASSWKDQERSFFREIRYCAPGESHVVSAEGHRHWLHWTPDFGSRIRYRKAQDYAEHFREIFRKAVHDRLPSSPAEPVGLSLSGGLDSACLAAELAGQGRRVVASSWVFADYPSCDERSWIDATVRRLGIESHRFQADHLGPLSDAPFVFGDFAGQDPYQRLAQRVAEVVRGRGCTLLFSGHFADLLFSGGAHWAGDMFQEGRWGTLLAELGRHPRMGFTGLRQILGATIPRPRGSLRRRIRRRWTGRLHPRLLSDQRVIQALRAAEPGAEAPGGRRRRWDHLRLAAVPQGESAARQWYNRLGVEAIDPYRDRRLVELMLAFPADQLARPPLTKRVLRRAFRNELPEALLRRQDKTSLLSLFEYHLLRRNRRRLENLLSGGKAVAGAYVEKAWLQRELEAGSSWSEAGYALWLTATLEAWLQSLEGKETHYAQAV